ncbi:biotin carboxylase [Paenibacillus phyllosphaerae]|uniref:Biotin carboxylase n=1 Tax=Paenibacillus phyllosphaerae TaxID=274593 RepID=A0A7W5B0M0_9BACL|nr:ATP-grasp domain-containing protein [Paenibacillus phyllosphaerae]MBB3112260.1 biotin carboxylase [Paenibacillus phyllosphaerae]
MTSNLPKIAVIHGEGSASPLTIKAATLGLCQPVFLYAADCPQKDKAQLELLKNHAGVHNLASLSDHEAVALLRQEQVAGIVTFSEYELPTVTRYAAELGLTAHSGETLLYLTDKYAQRERLGDCGVHTVRHAIVDRSHPERTATSVGFPSVLKPRVGAGSRWTVKVNTLDELRQALSASPADGEYVLEEYLAGDPAMQGQFYGDYVSVESVHRHGVSQQVCITAKLPLTAHFAETGMFVPHPFSPELAERISALESQAIQAMGIADGVTHTEIKLTADGPKIIEVNGRLGGYVPEIVKRAMGVDLVRVALQAALGQEVKFAARRNDSVVYQVFVPAPVSEPAWLAGMNGTEEAVGLDGVLHIEMTKDKGQLIDYRLGTQSNLGIVYGEAPDWESFAGRIQEIRATLVPKLTVPGGNEVYAR